MACGQAWVQNPDNHPVVHKLDQPGRVMPKIAAARMHRWAQAYPVHKPLSSLNKISLSTVFAGLYYND